MGDTKELLARAIQVVGFLLAAFGGFLTDIAPPGGWLTKFSVGLASFAALGVLLLISGMSRRAAKSKVVRRWLMAGAVLVAVAIGLGLAYVVNWDRLTFAYPPETRDSRFIAGTELTASAKDYRERRPTRTTSEMVADFGGPQYVERVWEESSLRMARWQLIIQYVAFVLSVIAMIFCFTEGVLRRQQST